MNLLTCTGVAIGQVRRDSDGPALVHTHVPQTLVDPSDEAPLPQQAHLGRSSLVASRGKSEAHVKRG